jgi:hypothetical protein
VNVVTLHSHVNYVVGENTEIGQGGFKKSEKSRDILHAVLPDLTPAPHLDKCVQNDSKL